MHQVYINQNDQQIGPFTVDEINQKLESGELVATDGAWIDGMSDWKPLVDGDFAAIGVVLPSEDEHFTETVVEAPPPRPSPPPAAHQSARAGASPPYRTPPDDTATPLYASR